MFALALAGAISLVMSTAAVAQQAPPDTGTPQGQRDSGVRWDGDSVRVGDSVRLTPKVRVQGDFRLRDESGETEDRFEWGNRRIGIEGELFRRFEFQIERSLKQDNENTPWRDVYGDFRISRALRIRAGRFKMPFSMERTTSVADLDFTLRATAVTEIAPGRDEGVMVHGRLADRLFEYEAGVFRHGDGFDIPSDANPWGPLGATLVGRIAVAPIEDDNDGFTHDLRFGAAFARNNIPEGPNSLRGRFISGDEFFDRVFVNGQRTRLGAEGLWSAGRVTLKGELLRVTDERKQQAVTGEDLSNLVVSGAYVTGTYRVFGDRGRRGPAVDVAARVDRMSFGSANQSDDAFTNPRADHLAPLSKDTWTFGATYIVHRWIKVQVNTIRERLVDPLDVRDLTPGSSWTSLLRVQFAM